MYSEPRPQDGEQMTRIKFFLTTGLSLFLVTMAVQPICGGKAAPDIRAQLQQVIDGFQGQVALAAKNLRTGETVEINSNEKVQTASVIKVPIMVEAFYQSAEGRVEMDDFLILDSDNKVQGSGILCH